MDGSTGCPWCIASKREEERQQAESERDEARAEVERLRAGCERVKRAIVDMRAISRSQVHDALDYIEAALDGGGAA